MTRITNVPGRLPRVMPLLLPTPDVPPAARWSCRYGLGQLGEASDQVPPIGLPERIVHDRLTRHYPPLPGPVGLLRRCLSPVDPSGDLAAATFLLDNPLLERLLEEALRKALREQVTVTGPQTTHLDIDERVGTRPGLVLRERNGRVVLVGGVRDRLVDDAVGPPADHDELLASRTRCGIDDDAVLCTSADATSPARVVTVHDSGVRVPTSWIDPSGSPEELCISGPAGASQVHEMMAGRRHAMAG